MSNAPPTAEVPALIESAHDRTPGPEEAQALLRDCGRDFCSRLFEATRASLDLASDLFESATGVPDGEIESFRAKRREWVEAFEGSGARGSEWMEVFERVFNESLAQWHAGHRRTGRRPDRDASAASLSVLTPIHQEKQAALVEATAFLRRFTRREHDALNARVGVLVPSPTRDLDNPFGPQYVIDALGVTSRGVYPQPRIWRSLMVRVLADLTPTINKIYISQNRMLADRGVLPDMKAALRARSELRPSDDKELLPTFSRLLSEVGALPTDIAIPPLSDASPPGDSAGASSASLSATTPPGAPGSAVASAGGHYAPAPEILPALAALAELAKGSTSARTITASQTAE